MQVEVQFDLACKVYSVSMSSTASAHALIAVGSQDADVRLCDLASGAFTHTLTGHNDAVWSTHWSVSSEWVLATGGCDGAVKLWDVRKAGGSFLSMDQHQSFSSMRGNRNASQVTGHGLQPREAPRNAQRLQSGSNPSAVKARRGHPGLTAGSKALAHDGAVTSVKPSPDGRHLLSAGTDSRLRLWDMESGSNTLVNYEKTYNKSSKAVAMALSQDGRRVFLPCGNLIQEYDVLSGKLVKILRGHFEAVTACEFHPIDQELYSSSADCQILAWTPPNLQTPDDPPTNALHKTLSGTLPDVDSWSDDDNFFRGSWNQGF